MIKIWVLYGPIYSAFYSPLFGGPLQAKILGVYDDNGEYFAQAATYLNTKGRDIKVYVPFNVDSFKPYFKGKLNSINEGLPDYALLNQDSRRTSQYIIVGCTEFDTRYQNQNLYPVAVFKCDPNQKVTLTGDK